MFLEHGRLEGGYGFITGRFLSTLKGKTSPVWAGEENNGPSGGHRQGRGRGKVSGTVAGAPILGAGDDLVPRTLVLKTVGPLETVWVPHPQLLHWPGCEKGPLL